MSKPVDCVVPGFVGRTYLVRYAELSATNAYAEDGVTMAYEITEGSGKGNKGTVSYKWADLGEGVYAISWQESDDATVVHIDDFARGRSLSFYTTPDHRLYRLSGDLSLLD
ncbi:hypothetical protein KPL74_06260 [Bacillus sp. NP157]|nr:hypothetical protein KPL74_06260 [Bacillus sp. NP157]